MYIRIEWKEGGNVQGMFGIPNGTILSSLGAHPIRPQCLRTSGLPIVFWYIDATDERAALYGGSITRALSAIQIEWPDVISVDVLPVKSSKYDKMDEWEDTYLTPFIEGCP